MIAFKTDNTSRQCCPHRKRLCPVVQLLVDCFLFSVTAPVSFDDPPETETLNHLTANRAKVPQKRPPSKVLHSIMSHSHKSLKMMFKSCFFFTEAAHCTFIDGNFKAILFFLIRRMRSRRFEILKLEFSCIFGARFM